jgi:hypothetical protein
MLLASSPGAGLTSCELLRKRSQFGGTDVIDLFSPNRVLMAVCLSFLLIIPQGMFQRLHAQSPAPRHITRPGAGWTVPAAAPLPPVRQAPGFRVLVIRGDGAVNNISAQTAEEPVVEIRDDNGNPIEGAAVTFFVPATGPSVVFGGGATILGTVTDGAGRAAGTEMIPNDVQGSFQIEVQVAYQQRTATTTITQTNTLTGQLEGGGSSTTMIVILGIIGGAAAGLGLALTGGGNGGGGDPIDNPLVRITPGTPSVGSPR